MRICVVHLVSLLILMLPLFLNLYLTWPGQTLETSLVARYSNMKAMIRKSLSSRAKEIEAISSTLQDVSQTLDRISDATSRNEEQLSNDLCSTSRNVNYADVNLGAQVESVHGNGAERSTLSKILGLDDSPNPPVNLLSSNMTAGCCFAFESSQAEIQIKLAAEVFVTSIAIQHIAKHRSPSRETSNAPQNFCVYGIHPTDGTKIPLGCFEFLNQGPCQKFKMPVKQKFRKLIFKFETNHGNPSHTCVYRILVYGHP